MDLQGRRILIIQQRGWAMTIGHFLAKRMQTEGARLSVLTLKRTTHDFIVQQQEVKYELIVSLDDLMSRPDDFLSPDDNLTLKEICRELGVVTIWPLVQSVRNYVKSYGDKYYYGFKQNVPDELMVACVKATFKQIKKIFAEFGPELIIASNIISLPQIMLHLYALKQGILTVAVTDSKVRGYYLFSQSYLDDRSALLERVDELNQGAVSVNINKAREYIKEFREKFKAPAYSENKSPKRRSWLKFIRHELSPYYHVLQWYFKRPVNYWDSAGITPDWRPPRIILRDFYCARKYRRFDEKFSYYPIDKIRKFVYFPLQFQPEAAIDVMAPMFNNQLETARLVAMSLPDDYTLVVKEHPAMVGYRNPSYLEKVNRTPNVKLIDYRLPSQQVLSQADLVISPNSTTLAEAAFYNKPAIQLGNLGTTLKLPNVFKHSDLSTLTYKIKEVLSLDLKTADYEKRLENFVAAVIDTGFTFNYTGVWERGDQENLEPLWQIWLKEIKRLLK